MRRSAISRAALRAAALVVIALSLVTFASATSRHFIDRSLGALTTAADRGAGGDAVAGSMRPLDGTALQSDDSDIKVADAKDKSKGTSKPPKDQPPTEEPVDEPTDDPSQPPADEPTDPVTEPEEPQAPPSAPAAPTSAECVSGDMEDVITFESDGSGGPVDSYVLLRSISADGPFEAVASCSQDEREIRLQVQSVGTAYYRLRAEGPGGASAETDTVSNAIVGITSEVTPAGKTLRASNGELVLTLPSGAFEETTTLTVDELSGSPVGGIIAFAGVYAIEPSGQLSAPATLSVAYKLAVTHFQVSDTLLRAAGLFTYNASSHAWVSGAANVRAEAGYIVGEVSHFSEWTPGSPSPHGTNAEASGYCSGICHDLTTYPGSSTKYGTRDPQICYNCHGNSSATDPPLCGEGDNVQAEFFAVPGQTAPAIVSKHPVVNGGFYCTFCHDPHATSSASPDLLKAWDPSTGLYIQGGSGSGPGTAYCWTCHGSVVNKRVNYYVPGYYTRSFGDHKTWLNGTAHATLTTEDSKIACSACHASHGSTSSALTIVGTVDGRSVTGNDQSLCRACHELAIGGYSGEASYAMTKHSSVTASTVAATRWPTSESSPGGCQNCHNPHGSSNPDYLRASGAALCRGCHDVSGLSYPADYSYQGAAVYGSSGHAGLEGALSYVGLGPASDGFAAWESSVTPTPASPGSPITEAAALNLRAADGSRLRTRLNTATGSHDYQMYRFKVPATSADVVKATMRWAGYGEETSGYPVTISLWVPATSSWQQVTSAVMATQQLVTTQVTPATHMDSDGYVYVLAQAKHVYDAEVTSGPTFTKLSDTAIRVQWTTAGLATTWVDYGLTTAYGSSMGTDTRTTSHSVDITGLTLGTWNFRVRSDSRARPTGDEGENYISANYQYGFPTPKLSAPYPPDVQWTGVPVTATCYWQAMTSPAGPYQYRLQLYNTGTHVLTTDWISDTNYTLTNLGLGNWQWRIEARDANGLSYGWSVWDYFYIYEPSGSCPFLFTWDGEKFGFEADLFGPGKLALKTKSGYVRPTPDDVYVLKHEPQTVDGRIDLRLVEERFETDYLDTLALYALDVPSGRDVYAEKREGGGAPFGGVSSVLHTVAQQLASPVSAVHIESGADVSALIAADDDRQLVLNEDRNKDFTYQTIELDLGDVADAPQLKVVMDAVSMFPTNPEGAAYAATFGPRTKLEVQDAAGAWVSVPASAGALPKPPEFSRTYAFDISNIWVSDSRKVRFTFLMKTYVDWIAIDTTEDLPVTLSSVPLTSAVLGERGYDPTSSDEEIFEYVYGEPSGRTGYFPGAYTKLGEVSPLLETVDDMFVIFGGGDEIKLSFDAPAPPASGTTRRFVIHTNGYYKDTKTDIDEAVEPLPFAAMSNFPYPDDEHYPDDPEHQAYLKEWNTRVKEGSGVTAAGTTWGEDESSLMMDVRLALMALLNSASDSVAMLAHGTTIVELSEYQVDHRSLNSDLVSLDLTISGSAAGGECGACHNVHGAAESGVTLTGGRAASDGKTCTADGTGGCHDNAANSVNGVNIRQLFTASSDPRTHHDVFPSDQIRTGAKTACGDCHNPHSNNRVYRYSDPDAISQPVASSLASVIAGDGSVYVAVGAAHDATPPLISGISLNASGDLYASPIITWTTNELSTSWIDWGLTTDYELGNETTGSPYGNNALVASHSVQMTGLTTGQTYHYRIRTTDALGNTAYSADMTYTPIAPPPVPVMSDLTTVTGSGWGPISATLNSSAVTAPDGDAVQYEFQVDGQPSMTSGWINVNSFVTPDWFYTGWHYARVRARDAVHTNAVSSWSAADSFYVEAADDPSGSCPFLFTWDGDSYEFETDLMMSGKLGNKISTGYQMPNPQDAYTLHHQPASVDGRWKFRMVEERFEVDYIDHLQLFAADAPAGYTVYAEKPGVGGKLKEVAAQLHTVKDPVAPVSAHRTDTGEDISGAIAADDDHYVVLNEDRNDFTYKTIELDLGDVQGATQVKLLIDGASAFFNSAEGTALSATYGPRTKVEVQQADGSWYLVPSSELFMPVPPEFARTYVFDMTKALAYGGPKVRLTFLYKTYIDMIKVDTSTDQPITLTEAPLLKAELRHHGIDGRRVIFEDVYEHVYGDPNDLGGFFPGAYTAYRDVVPLLTTRDDMFAIMGGGDELDIEFVALAPPASGMERQLVMGTHGYYKDQKTDLPHTVDPLPFSAMSSYPYPDDEHYPDDAEHVAYLEEWNTRLEGQDSGTAASAAASGGLGVIVWRSLHASPHSEYRGDVYSVDTDYIGLKTNTSGGTATVAASAGWESDLPAASRPTPASPGAPIDSERLTYGTTSDNNHIRTDLSTSQGNWNWQVFKFDLGSNALAQLNGLNVVWEGHGEPTPDHPTAVLIWNPQTSQWVQIAQKMMPTDTVTGAAYRSVPSAYCLKCHDGTPPEGVVLGTITNVGATWNLTTTDFHGGKSGTGKGGTLAPGYARGSEVPCSTCHDTHGSASIYHFPTNVNDKSLPVITGTNTKELCTACHVGTLSAFHSGSGCNDCHGQDFSADHGYFCPSLESLVVNCLDCHKHGKSWTHPESNPSAPYCWSGGCSSEHGGPPKGGPAF